MREKDAEVAEKVMGWRRSEFNDCHFYPFGKDYRSVDGDSWWPFTPSKSAEHDYEVLKHVRETWPKNEMEVDMFDRFLFELGKIWDERSQLSPGYGRNHELARFYEPGDYSEAALRVVSEK